MNLNKIDANLEKRGRRRIIVPAPTKPRMTAEEYNIWKTDWQAKRSGGSLGRWRTGTNTVTDGFKARSQIIKRVVKKPAKTPDKYSLAPIAIRELIKTKQAEIAERAKILNVMT